MEKWWLKVLDYWIQKVCVWFPDHHSVTPFCGPWERPPDPQSLGITQAPQSSAVPPPVKWTFIFFFSAVLCQTRNLQDHSTTRNFKQPFTQNIKTSTISSTISSIKSTSFSSLKFSCHRHHHHYYHHHPLTCSFTMKNLKPHLPHETPHDSEPVRGWLGLRSATLPESLYDV